MFESDASHALAQSPDAAGLVQSCCNCLGKVSIGDSSPAAPIALLSALALGGQQQVYADARSVTRRQHHRHTTTTHIIIVSIALTNITSTIIFTLHVSPTHSHRITFRNVIAIASACLSDAKTSKSTTASSVPPTASAYILLIRCLYLPPPPIQR